MQRLPLLFAFALTFCAAGFAGTLFLPAYPSNVIVVDEASGKITDTIKLQTGTPLGLQLSSDHKRVYVTTVDHNGIEVIDVATHKVLSHVTLNTPTKQYRFMIGTPDPEGKLFYTVTKEITQFPEHFEVAKPKYTVVDLEQQKIVKMVDIPKEEEATNQLDWGSGWMAISPDGKYLYQFGKKITIMQASDFKVIDHIDLGRPDAPGMENVHFGGDLDLFNEPGEHMSIFVSSDPIVHNKVFGLARFNLSTKEMVFNPIGPAPNGMAGLEVTPDRKEAYTIVSSGIHGTKRCEFWAFDLATDRIKAKEEVPCRTRFTLGISADGKKLYIYGAGFQIEVYDTATLKLEKTWDLNVDVAMGGIAVLP
jgi:DNA-binding beta-propeller fold protein YncE